MQLEKFWSCSVLSSKINFWKVFFFPNLIHFHVSSASA